jgi:hypothetical protein
MGSSWGVGSDPSPREARGGVGPPKDGPRAHAREPQVPVAKRRNSTEDVPAEAGTQTRKRGPGAEAGETRLAMPQSFTYFWKLFLSFISLGGITARQ